MHGLLFFVCAIDCELRGRLLGCVRLAFCSLSYYLFRLGRRKPLRKRLQNHNEKLLTAFAKTCLGFNLFQGLKPCRACFNTFAHQAEAVGPETFASCLQRACRACKQPYSRPIGRLPLTLLWRVLRRHATCRKTRPELRGTFHSTLQLLHHHPRVAPLTRTANRIATALAYSTVRGRKGTRGDGRLMSAKRKRYKKDQTPRCGRSGDETADSRMHSCLYSRYAYACACMGQ